MSLKIELNNGVYMIYKNPRHEDGRHVIRIYGLPKPFNGYESLRLLQFIFGRHDYRHWCIAKDKSCDIWEIADIRGSYRFADIKDTR
jgi:hypothetical protein